MPKHWKRPLTQMYKINYNYGTSLYSNCLDELDRKSNNRLSGTYDYGSGSSCSERHIRTANQLMEELKAEGDAFVADQKHNELIVRSIQQVQARRKRILHSIEV
ncbi:uncharacterized protein LOC111273238 isoform X2 [Varroa jacobsoni]|uniref:uncharacterized protein LOC111273238 isoform X2 n=1 Tax=Varroa jacobsoni TaxID=62625 RepID=UPI000BF464DA|nr:uncharacterized protein LOC111273238 isoform X2 [Varroa jacobsoni]